jgi:sarcosine oxidase subunit gamma
MAETGIASATLRPLPPRARFALRGDPAVLAAAGTAFGVTLPTTPLTSAVAGPRAALWLGPDEILLLAEQGAVPPAIAGVDVVDISDGCLGCGLDGAGAALALNEGCPLDLDLGAFPVGACTRTVFGKLGILLWRRAPHGFEIDVPRSFAADFRMLLQAALDDLDTAANL